MGYKIESDVCFKTQASLSTNEMIRYYNHYKNNVLMYSGGIMDQPAKYLEAMELIGQLLNNA